MTVEPSMAAKEMPRASAVVVMVGGVSVEVGMLGEHQGKGWKLHLKR